MSTIAKEITTVSAGLVAGAAIGAAMGLLLAPQDGVRTRRKIKRYAKRTQAKASFVGDDLRDALDRASHYCKELVA